MAGAQPGPGETPEKRSLHVFFVVDCSGSMAGERIGALNWAAMGAVPVMREAADEHPEVDVLVRVIRFADGVDWPVAEPTPVRRFAWQALAAGGETRMGAALEALAGALASLDTARTLPSVVILFSDGLPTDDARAGMAALAGTALGAQAIRIPIAIGPDADLDLLQEFIGDRSFKPLRARNADTLVSRIRWAVTGPIEAASRAGPGAPAPAAIASPPRDGGADDLVW